jgi:hypothetical protein
MAAAFEKWVTVTPFSTKSGGASAIHAISRTTCSASLARTAAEPDLTASRSPGAHIP